jgi:hypothetical protein
VESYVEKYVAKPERFPEGVETGRVWGRGRRRCSPLSERRLGSVSLEDAYRIRRIYRKSAKMRGRGNLHRLTAFIRHENVMRLLEFMGYRQQE